MSGLLVLSILPNSPAEKAGLHQNDLILSIGQRAIQTPEDLRKAVEQEQKDDLVLVEGIRNQVKFSINMSSR